MIHFMNNVSPARQLDIGVAEESWLEEEEKRERERERRRGKG